MRRYQQFHAAIQGTAFIAVVGGTRGFTTHATQHQAIALQTAEAEDRSHRLRTFLAQLHVSRRCARRVTVAEYQHGSLRIGFKDFRNASERAEGDRQ
ncbi:hypothetical protein D3C72_1956400 [compost metagenome]